MWHASCRSRHISPELTYEREPKNGDQATGRRDPEGDRPPREGEVRPDLPKTPACYGFTIIASVKPGRAEAIRGYGHKLAKALEADPYLLAPLKLHYLRWVLFDNDTRFMYQGIFDTDFDKYTEDAVVLFSKTGVDTVFENLEGFPRTGRRTPRRSSSSSASTSARASWSTAEYPYVTRRRDQEGPEDQARLVRDARPDAVGSRRAGLARQTAPSASRIDQER